ncbi:N-acetylmuramoyl-L-alanine amidase [bacterium]|nr:N-acetylmuramoyl-L-alanine amidase [bacterium]
MNYFEFEKTIQDISKKLSVHQSKEIPKREISQIDKIIFHCTAQNWNVWQVCDYDLKPNHIDASGCPCITYTYFIEKNGTVYKCLDFDVKSWHVGKWNASSLGFCIAYNGNPKIKPKKIQIQKAIELAAYLCLKLGIEPKNVLGHRELEETGFRFVNGEKILRKECPGLAINLDDFRENVFSLIKIWSKNE